MRHIYTRFTYLIIILGFSTIMGGCAKDQLQELERFQFSSLNVQDVKVDYCTLPANPRKSKLKFIFVMDKSGSNGPILNEPGTDPIGQRRYSPLVNYLNNTVQDADTYFTLINFSSDSNFVLNQDGSTGFTNDIADFTQTAQDEWNKVQVGSGDGGWTNYLKSLERIEELITNDVEQAKLDTQLTGEFVSSYYTVIFISDGVPISGANPDGTLILQDSREIISKVKAVVDIDETNRDWVDTVQINTGYYYLDAAARDSNAANLMTLMAFEGFGNYFEFGAGQVVDYNNFSVPEKKIQHNLVDIIVTNASALWHNGQYMLDSDRDGLPDTVEIDLGSDPNLRDSDGNLISDAVEYYATGRPCLDKACSPTGAAAYQNCSLAQKTEDFDNDLLTNCEESILIGSNFINFDSNDDWLPDFLAMRNNVSITQDATILPDSDSDGISNYLEVKRGTPVITNNSKVIGLKEIQYDNQLVSSTVDQKCYSLNATDISTLGPNNMIRVYLLESPTIGSNRKFLRWAEKPLVNGGVVFTPADFVLK